jgi:hypothetical protein
VESGKAGTNPPRLLPDFLSPRFLLPFPPFQLSTFKDWELPNLKIRNSGPRHQTNVESRKAGTLVPLAPFRGYSVCGLLPGSNVELFCRKEAQKIEGRMKLKRRL